MNAATSGRAVLLAMQAATAAEEARTKYAGMTDAERVAFIDAQKVMSAIVAHVLDGAGPRPNDQAAFRVWVDVDEVRAEWVDPNN